MEKFNAIFDEIQKFTVICESVFSIEIRNKHIKKYPNSYFISLCLRLLISIQSSIELLKLSKKNKYHLCSVIVLIRPSLLDSLYLHYLIGFIKNEKDENGNEVQDELIFEQKKIHCNQIFRFLKDVRDINNCSTKEINFEDIKKIIEECPECFNDEFESHKNINALIASIKNEFKNSITVNELLKKSYNKNESLKLYEDYQFFSKYEHYGELSKKISDTTHQKTDDLVELILFSIGALIKIIEKISHFIISDSDKHTSFINECSLISSKIKNHKV